MLVKEIHQPGFSPPDTAPDIQSPDDFRPLAADPVEDPWPALTLEGMPQVVQGFYNTDLRRVRLKIALPGEILVVLKWRGFRRHPGLRGIRTLGVIRQLIAHAVFKQAA